MTQTMHLRVHTPKREVVDAKAIKIVAEAENGSFCLLPKHVDFVAALAPGLLSYTVPETRELEGPSEQTLAVDAGILVKVGDEVSVATQRAVEGGRLGGLTRRVARETLTFEEDEANARTAVAKLEAGFVRHFLELRERRNV